MNMNISSLVLLLTLAAAHGGPTGRIVGGSDAVPHYWPWQLSLQNSNSHSCGASLLSDRFAVTAAHCVDGANLVDLKIVAGAHALSEAEASRQEVTLSQFTIHPDYTSSLAYPNDVAVLTFSTPLNLTNEVRPARLVDNNNNDFAGYTDCFITGWGRLEGGGPLPYYLQEAQTTVLDTGSCRTQLGIPGLLLSGVHVCVHTGNNGACNGDSGGPLVCKEGTDWLLIGATSWGLANCPTDSPSVYARLSAVQSWIRGITGPLE